MMMTASSDAQAVLAPSDNRAAPQTSIYPGWKVVFAGWVGELMSAHPVLGFTFSVFLGTLISVNGWTQGAGAAWSIYLLCASLSLPIWGALIERIGARWCITLGVLLVAAVVASFGVMSSLMHWYAGYALLGLFSGGISAIPYLRTASVWFDRRRGLAMGMVMSGGGVCAVIAPPLAQWSITSIGWQSTYLLMAALLISVTLPVTWTLLIEHPSEVGISPAEWGEVSEEGGSSNGTRGQAAFTNPLSVLRHAGFWAMSISTGLAALSLNGMVAHMVPMLRGWDYTAMNAAVALSILGVGSLTGRVATGWLLDRMAARHVAAIIFFIAGFSLIDICLFPHSRFVILGGAFFIGIAIGSENDVIGYMVSRLYPTAFFGQIYGYAYMVFIIGAALGPASVAIATSHGINQVTTVLALGLILFLASAIMLRAPSGAIAQTTARAGWFRRSRRAHRTPDCK